MSNSRYELDLMLDIAVRAEKLFGPVRERINWVLDVENAHAHMPMRLHELLAAPDIDFAHDMGGIYRHMNRTTGKLEDCFVPRFAMQ